MRFVIFSLAIWRICHFIAKDDGPWMFMWEIRYRLSDGWLYKPIKCVACSSMWIAFPMTYIFFNDNQLLVWLATSAVATLLEVIWDAAEAAKTG